MILQQEDTEENHLLSAELFRIEQYTEMALQYLRLDSKTNDFVFQQYDLDSIIRQAIRKYAPQFILRKIRLIYEPVSAFLKRALPDTTAEPTKSQRVWGCICASRQRKRYLFRFRSRLRWGKGRSFSCILLFHPCK